LAPTPVKHKGTKITHLATTGVDSSALWLASILGLLALSALGRGVVISARKRNDSDK
jgi:hypothetical protein